MHGLPASSRPTHFKPGASVQHPTHGVGRVLGEWGPIEVVGTRGSCELANCHGIYDVEFGIGPHRVLHCCRGEYLQRMAIRPAAPIIVNNIQ